MQTNNFFHDQTIISNLHTQKIKVEEKKKKKTYWRKLCLTNIENTQSY